MDALSRWFSMARLLQWKRSLPVFLKEVSLDRSSSCSTRRIFHWSPRRLDSEFTATRMMVSSICPGVQSPRERRYRWSLTVSPRWIAGMASNLLKLNADKTQFIWLGSRQQLLKVEIDSIQLGSGSVSLKSSVNNLGVIFDSQLSMRDHVRHVCHSCFYQLRQLRVVRRSLTFEASAQLVHAFINSRLDYCNSLLAGLVTSWSVSSSRCCERRPDWFYRRRNSITSTMTFETSYTGFRSGSESRSNFVGLFFAACAVKPLHTSRRCSLWYRTVMRCDRIVRQLVVISSYREHSPRLSTLVGCGLWTDCMERTPTILEKQRSVSHSL